MDRLRFVHPHYYHKFMSIVASNQPSHSSRITHITTASKEIAALPAYLALVRPGSDRAIPRGKVERNKHAEASEGEDVIFIANVAG